ncbi:hypothetical protein BHS09_37315 [Myxococcus xanthus]|uniref:Zinc-finger domain-containing protein n=2 Tax=Myxococcus xanthus TaxID=34 RepID=A0AAE6G7U4_MYXXA|nr:hypothetical protein BHS09_37315 [Myxococcus xanthus]QDE79461.1 hypothetical protein BHS08_37340 [Myxococcus xanthus]
MSPSCALLPLVDRHFSGRIAPLDERRMREHLPDCAHCRERYERQLLLARMDPSAPDARTRLARGLGLGASALPRPEGRASDARANAPHWWHLALVPVAVACLTMLVVRLPSAATDDTGFTARGAGNAAAQARLLAYAVTPGGHTTLLGPTLRPEQELAFAFRNPDAHRFLMVFARDTAGRVYWYHPSWADPASNPSAIPIPDGDTLRELPEAISHPLAPGALTLHAVFLESPLTVRQMESLVEQGDLDTVLPAGADVTSLQLQVIP